MILDTVTKTIELILGSAVTTTAMPVTVDYVDMTSTITLAGSSDSQSNGVTLVTILAAPAASTQRKVNSINVYNADSASKVVTIRLNNNTVLRPLVVVTLQVGDTLIYTDVGGWYVMSATGLIKNGQSIAADITNTPAGNIAATTVQAAINELDAEKAKLAGDIAQAFSSSNFTTAQGLVFPATQNPSANVNTLDDYEEGTWTPNVTAVSGTFTTVSATGRYIKIGAFVSISVTITITTNGTAAGAIYFTLPFVSGVNSAFAGKETLSVGFGCNASVAASSSSVVVAKYDATYPGASGYTIFVGGDYSV